MPSVTLILILIFLVARVFALNFDWERDQLTEETGSNAASRFSSATAAAASLNGCRFILSDADWPSEEEWVSFNQTLDGALLKPKPLASVCYAGEGYSAAKCEQLKNNWADMNLHTDDPTSIMSQWASGNTCTPTSQPNSTCIQGVWPVYVVKAASIRHIQVAEFLTMLPGTFGILTSVVVKASPPTPLVSGRIRFSTTPPRGSSAPPAISTETFWAGMKAYWEHSIAICDAGGLGYSFIYPSSSSTGLTFTVSISVPNKTLVEYRTFIAPLLEKLNDLGIPQSMPTLQRDLVPRFEHGGGYGDEKALLGRRALGEITGHTLIASRFFSRSNFNTSSSLATAHVAIRHLVEDGELSFHGMNYVPLASLSANPSNAVNPAFRTTVLHAQAFEPNAHWDGKAVALAKEALTARHARLQGYMQSWRDVTPESGSYINEGDAQDWEWKEAFFGPNYARLAAIKRRYDGEVYLETD
ncbi:hypothetical protein EJ02DRAFT_468733 [Clathrospora elynae]|uniref:Berberine/berberine-like domain-containing protein n=1 Tax=Clathrospora elynae TaxID=706981 RepID=A0A6A5SGA5_9PLEO|nr:hypothetical protein EJ02DRAFT_468733 [Clathrospora elynae]